MRMEDIDANRMGRMIAGRLRGNIPRMLRAISFSFSPYVPPTHGHVVMRAHFLVQPTADDLDQLNDMEGELYADTPHDWTLESTFDFEIEVQLAPVGTKIYPREHIAWVDPMEAHRKA
jgi:hypothetical protein